MKTPLLSAVASGRKKIDVGKARDAPWLRRFAPGLLAAMLV
jgi:hypothetical protein